MAYSGTVPINPIAPLLIYTHTDDFQVTMRGAAIRDTHTTKVLQGLL